MYTTYIANLSLFFVLNTVFSTKKLRFTCIFLRSEKKVKLRARGEILQKNNREILEGVDNDNFLLTLCASTSIIQQLLIN